MAKPRAPGLSGGLSGSIGEHLTYGTWKGRPTVRRKVRPRDPATAGQTANRGTFGSTQLIWRLLPEILRDPWRDAAKGQPLTAINLMLRVNVPALAGKTDMADFQPSVQTFGMLQGHVNALQAVSVQRIRFLFHTPEELPGYTLGPAFCIVLKDHDPTTMPPETNLYYTQTGDQPPDADSGALVATGESSTAFACYSFFRFQHTSGRFAYSEPLNYGVISTSA